MLPAPTPSSAPRTSGAAPAALRDRAVALLGMGLSLWWLAGPASRATAQAFEAAANPWSPQAPSMQGLLWTHAVAALPLLFVLGYAAQPGRSRRAFDLLGSFVAPAWMLGTLVTLAMLLPGQLRTAAAAQGANPWPDAMSGAEVAQQMLGALAWSHADAGRLPGWARGGHQVWPLPNGQDLPVQVTEDRVVVLAEGLPSSLCQDTLRSLLDRPSPWAKARVEVDDRPLGRGWTMAEACASSQGHRVTVSWAFESGA